MFGTNFQHEVQRHSCQVLPVCSDITCCYHISVGINKSSPERRRNTSRLIQTSSACEEKPKSSRIKGAVQSEVVCTVSFQPSSHLQPFSMSQISIRPSKEVVARRPSLRNTQLEMPSQLLTSDFTSCSQPQES